MLKNDDKTLQIWPPKLVPENILNEIAGLRHFLPRRHFLGFFLSDFFRAFGALWVLLGRLLGFLRVSWEVSGPKNTKNPKVFQGFLKAVVWLFEAPDGSLGLILPPLWPIWSQNGAPKLFPKMLKKHTKIWPSFFYYYIFQDALTWLINFILNQLLEPFLDQGSCTKFLKILQEKPRWAQEGHHEL